MFNRNGNEIAISRKERSFEIFDEEKKLLELLKDRSTSIFTKNGMNIRCAEKLIEKEQINLFLV